jgi:hypothetical protein
MVSLYIVFIIFVFLLYLPRIQSSLSIILAFLVFRDQCF